MAGALFLTWQDPLSRRWFPVGKLRSSNGHYCFEYIQGALTAREHGFEPIHGFPDLNARYESEELFPLFSNRVLPRSRPEYKSVLNWLSIGATENDRVAILSRSGGRRATDTFEVFPCPDINSSGEYHILFLIHGLSHMPAEAIARAEKLQPGEPLLMLKDFQNPIDPSAILLRTGEQYKGDVHIIGYSPAYLNSEIHSLLGENGEASPMILVERINLEPAPLQFRVLCRMVARPSAGFVPFRGSSYASLVNTSTESNNLELTPL
jgi:hypothetical protein